MFRQTASHLPHEGNVEKIFSLGGRLSDPNMNTSYLATLVFMGANQKVHMPPVKDVWQRYLRSRSRANSSKPMISAWVVRQLPLLLLMLDLLCE